MDDDRSNIAADGRRGCAFALARTTTAGMATVMAIVKVQPLVSNYTNSKYMGEDVLCSFYRFYSSLFRPNYFIRSLYSSITFTVLDPHSRTGHPPVDFDLLVVDAPDCYHLPPRRGECL